MCDDTLLTHQNDNAPESGGTRSGRLYHNIIRGNAMADANSTTNACFASSLSYRKLTCFIFRSPRRSAI